MADYGKNIPATDVTFIAADAALRPVLFDQVPYRRAPRRVMTRVGFSNLEGLVAAGDPGQQAQPVEQAGRGRAPSRSSHRRKSMTLPSVPALLLHMDLRTPLPAQAPATEGIADLGSVKLWYWDTGGSGEAVVLLHPGSGSVEAFPHQQPVFAKAGYRVISYSRRGQFKSELGSDSESCFAADDLLALLDHLGVARFHAVGTALGGYVGLDVALSQPGRVRSLVLASSMMGIAEPDYQKTLAALRPRPFSELPTEVQEVGPSYRVANPEGLAEWKARHDRAGKGSAVRLRNRATWEALARLEVPILLLGGDADLWIPPFLLRQVGEKIPRSRVVIIPDAGHALQWERPDAFNSAVLDFIAARRKA